jgi:tetratricopeptide (TPR) repeat protein
VLWLRFLWRPKGDARVLFLLVTSTAVMGPIGPLGVLITLSLGPWFARSAVPFEQWYAALFPDDDSAFESKLHRQAQAFLGTNQDEAATVVPFIDILSFGSRQQKQATITMITSRFHPSFAPVLRMALNDPNNAIRMQAATAMTRVENDFLQKSLQLSKAAQEDPENPDVVLALARHYDAYAFAGILDDKREQANREQAVAAYLEYLRIRPDDCVVRSEAGRLLVRKADYEQAASLLQPAVQTGNPSPALLLWHLESLFHLRRYAEIKALVARNQSVFEESKGLPAEVSDAIKLWRFDEDPCALSGGAA